MRAVAGQAATVRLQLATDDGQPVTGGPAPTVTVTAGDGTVLFENQQGSADTADGLGDGWWKWTLPGQTQLDHLTATWTATIDGQPTTAVEEVNVVGQRLISSARLRAVDTNLAELDPVSMLALVDQVEDLITDALGYSPVLEGIRTTWDATRGAIIDELYVAGSSLNGLPYGWGGGKMLIPGVRKPCVDPPGGFYAGSINGAAMSDQDIADLTVIDGCLAWSDGRPWIGGRYTAWLAHGDPTPPQDLRWAAQKLCSYYGQTSDFPDRATSVSTDQSTIVFALPSPDRPTGLPDVDGVLNRYGTEAVI